MYPCCLLLLSLSLSLPLLTAHARPNILILFADDLGSGDLSVYGHPTTSTPNLDALARSGIRFTQWYSGFHVCSPSRGSMMTGRIPVRIGLAGDAWTGGVFNADAVGGLPDNETTIAEVLRDNGYATKAIGKCEYFAVLFDGCCALQCSAV
jgi:arylsulfatase A